MSIDKRRAAANYLRALADAVDALDTTELDALLNAGNLRSLRAPPKKPRASNSRSKNQGDDQARADAVMDVLARSTTRAEAHAKLLELELTKAVLLKAAKSRAVHVVNKDSVAVIIDKLVANTVGSRLDSEAIRNG
ncbi:hypothetical protein [Sphingobium sp. HWE2-09]|uniref:hypothetical protein n=1 Tax=Sphingobium sp. HWE2-09 TaxID=3108390 RepID=UPI002DC45512|nr:hypothetical protein [Sphingobium sp. HWE2-09]